MNTARTVHNALTGEVSIIPVTEDEQKAIDLELVEMSKQIIAAEDAIPRATVGDKELLLTRAVFNTLRDAVLTSTALGDDTVTIVYEGEELLGTLEEARAAMRVFLATK